jgi:hypothetical protein
MNSRPHGSFVLATSDTKDVIVEHYTWLEENMMPVLKHIDNVREARLYVRTKIESMVKDDESGLCSRHTVVWINMGPIHYSIPSKNGLFFVSTFARSSTENYTCISKPSITA